MLKDLIQWLLNTRTTPAEAAHSCLPASSSVNITPDPSGTGTYIPPEDGYITATLKSDSNNLISFWGRLNTSNVSSAGVHKVQPKIFLPVEKGSAVGYTYTGEFLGFLFIAMKGIGGGYSCLLKEIELCLRTSCNFFLKRLSRVKRLGYPNNQAYLARLQGTMSRILLLLLTGLEQLTQRLQHQITVSFTVALGMFTPLRLLTLPRVKFQMVFFGVKLHRLTREVSSRVLRGTSLESLLNQPNLLVLSQTSHLLHELEASRYVRGGLPC